MARKTQDARHGFSRGATVRGATGARNQQTARAGEYFVAAEINRRGAYAVTFAGNMPKIDIVASNVSRTREASIQVKTRRSGTWQTSTDEGRRRQRPRQDEKGFWVFVDLATDKGPPIYYVVPDWWMRNDIYRAHRAYLKKHGGERAVNPRAKHHSIHLRRIAQWKNRWDVLKIF